MRNMGGFISVMYSQRINKMKFINKYTGEIWELDKVEKVSASPTKTVNVYVFKNRNRWSEDEFFRCWSPVSDNYQVKTLNE